METVTRFEVQRLYRPDLWGPLFSEGPVRFDTRREAAAEVARVGEGWDPLRIVPIEGVLKLSRLDLEEFVFPLVARFWRLWAPGQERKDLSPYIDKPRREQVGTDWARLSSWAGRSICFAPEVELPALARRFPFARPRTVEGVLRLLTLHELAHYVHGHNGLLTSLDHKGTPEALRVKRATMEAEADALTALWWREGMRPGNVPHRRLGVAS